MTYIKQYTNWSAILRIILKHHRKMLFHTITSDVTKLIDSKALLI